MATSKGLLVEQIMRRLNSGNPSVASKVHKAEVEKAVEQAVNTLLRPQYISTLQTGESIPETNCLVTYERIPVVPYNGVSKCTLPVATAPLPKRMDVWHITASEKIAEQLAASVIEVFVISSSQLRLVVDEVVNASSYLVQQSTNGTNWTTIGSTAGTYNRTNLTPETKFYFRVQAIGDGVNYVNSPFSQISATTEATPSIDITPPSIVSARVQDATPTEVELSYNKTLNTASLAASKFQVSINLFPVNTVSAAASGTKVTVVIDTPVNPGDLVEINYTPGASGSRIADTSANFATGLVAYPVTNNVV